MSDKYYGKYRGVVINNLDPLQLGRLMVQPHEAAGDRGACYRDAGGDRDRLRADPR